VPLVVLAVACGRSSDARTGDPEDGPDGDCFYNIDRLADFQRFLGQPTQTPYAGMIREAVLPSIGCVKCNVPVSHGTGRGT
jgi:hypothetical protein